MSFIPDISSLLLVLSPIYLPFMIYKVYKMYRLYNKYNDILRHMKSENSGNTVKIYDNYMEIMYLYMNKDYVLRVPYNPSLISKMTQYVVISNTLGKQMDITQQPGVPYLITAKELNSENIIVNDLDNDTVKVYTCKPPMYGEVEEII